MAKIANFVKIQIREAKKEKNIFFFKLVYLENCFKKKCA